MGSIPDRDLEGTVVLVTGARGGIGRAVCRRLREAGVAVAATGRSRPDEPLECEMWCDHEVTSSQDWARVLAAVADRFGRLDGLINNAGMSLVESFDGTSLEQWRLVMSVNVESAFLGMQASLPLLKESGKLRRGGSSIVNVSSISGLRGSSFGAAYCASKAAMTLLTKSVAKEFALLGYPIRVNSIHPGMVETGMTHAVLARCVEVGLASTEEKQRESWKAMSPLGRIALPDEVAGAVVFLTSPQASYINASQIVIDGGFIA